MNASNITPLNIKPLTNNENTMNYIDQAQTITLAEHLAAKNLCHITGSYFSDNDVKVKSIAKHWTNFIKTLDVMFSHPVQLEQASLQFLAYLKTKKSYSQMDMSVIEGSINCFVADRLLVIAYEKNLLTSEEVIKKVKSVLFLREIDGRMAKMLNKVCQYFLTELKNDGVDLVALSEQAVVEAFLASGDLVMETMLIGGRLALEVNNEAA
jgi:hypothetical protein